MQVLTPFLIECTVSTRYRCIRVNIRRSALQVQKRAPLHNLKIARGSSAFDNKFGWKKLKSILVELVKNKFLIRGGSALEQFFKGYVSEGKPDFFISLTEDDIRREEAVSRRRDKWRLSLDQLELCAIQRRIVSCLSFEGIVLFHGSAICVDRKTYIFTAPSGTGKSTHSRIWRELLTDHDVVMVNDDKPFLKVEEGRITAYGSPWRGKEGLGCNMSAPVEAICCISQGTENAIREATPEEMYPIFFEQSFRPFDKEGTENYLHTLDVLTRSVRLYKLECDISLDAARLSYETMAGEFSQKI